MEIGVALFNNHQYPFH